MASNSMVSYTVWSHGRLVGETDLGFERCFDKVRFGWFHPSEPGMLLMPDACGVRPALHEFYRMSEEGLASKHDQADGTAEIPFEELPGYAEVEAAAKREEGLELELRGPDGKVIPTESIGIQDTHFVLALAEKAEAERDEPEMELDAESLAEIEEMLARFKREPWESDDAWRGEPDDAEFPRYQIIVDLISEWDIP